MCVVFGCGYGVVIGLDEVVVWWCLVDCLIYFVWCVEFFFEIYVVGKGLVGIGVVVV